MFRIISSHLLVLVLKIHIKVKLLGLRTLRKNLIKKNQLRKEVIVICSLHKENHIKN
jgi:hypothetical protein